jgi:hypothetical protein
VASTIFDVTVRSVDLNTGQAKLMPLDENDDVVVYDLFIPACFGGATNPWPKAGEQLKIRYGRRTHDTGIIECWRERDQLQHN